MKRIALFIVSTGLLCSASMAYSGNLTPEEEKEVAELMAQEIIYKVELEIDMLKRLKANPSTFAFWTIDDRIGLIFDLEYKNVWLEYERNNDTKFELLGKGIGRIIMLRDGLIRGTIPLKKTKDR